MQESTTSQTVRSGLVIRKSLGRCCVLSDRREVVCSASSLLWKNLQYSTADSSSVQRHVVGVGDIGKVSPIVIGDEVRFLDQDDGTGRIVEILPRHGVLSRLAPGPKPREQTVVANVDWIVAVFAATQPDPVWGLLDRYLAAAEAAKIPALVCITKADLVADGALREELEVYERIGYPVRRTSSVTRAGIEALAGDLSGQISVLVGKSGVGKTSLLNAIEPGLGLRVTEVSGFTGKGKHTTTRLEMFDVDLGGGARGRIVDTPGVREFAPWELHKMDVATLFPEMRPLIGQCRFAGCSHSHEPGCAIKEAVEAGSIAAGRYRSFLALSQ
jgi:ribosome biogenesis GTPase